MGMEIIFEVGTKPKKVNVVGAEVIEDIVKDNEEIKVDVELKPVESFKEKEDLEAYGLTFGINLNKSKKLENMYADLEEFVASM